MTLEQAKNLLRKCVRREPHEEIGGGGYEWHRGNKVIAEAFGGDEEDPEPSVWIEDEVFWGNEAKQLVQCFKR